MLHTGLRGIEAVVFDVGETLVDESRAWATQARAAGVTPLTLAAALGSMIERGEDHRGVWALLGVAPPAAPPTIEAADLYPDALECLRAVRAAGLVVGIAGNQPAAATTELARLGFEADFVASSAGWGVEKPSPAFFERVVAAAGVPADRIAYIGDRLDNDVLPARAAGLRTVFIRRGPWGYLHSRHPEAALADLRIDSLTEFVTALA